jgi:mRNA-degrading endonuclease RelE of RelBE toxin-antitoxin system
MRVRLAARASNALQAAPPSVQKAFAKQARLLASNIHHPSLQTKKFGGSHGVWQGRVTRDWRFYFEIDGDVIAVTSIIPHPK